MQRTLRVFAIAFVAFMAILPATARSSETEKATTVSESAQSQNQSKKQQFFVQLHGTRENWPHNMTEAEEAVMSEHYTYLVNLMNQGKMLLAGPVLEPIFGLIILEVGSEAEARAIMDAEPSVVAGVHTYTIVPMVVSLLSMRYNRPTKTDRAIDLETVIPAPVSQVWEAWTTSDGVASWLTEANIELRLQGPYEIYFMPDQPYGQKGADGCHVLSYVPERMLSFEWNAPPVIPSLRNGNMRNWVTVFFEPVGESETKLSLSHQGWGDGADWDACFDYFSKAWPSVLEACKRKFGE